MSSHGIFTLANDVVLDQLIALLNSIRANVDGDIPVCVIPYDDRLTKVRREIAAYANVTLFDDQESIERWQNFGRAVATRHPEAVRTRLQHRRWAKGKLHRKFVCFDGPFEKFVFYDADSLAMKPLDGAFQKLEKFDFVFDDWEHGKADAVAALKIGLIENSGFADRAAIRRGLHCSSFFGSKKGVFGLSEISLWQKKLLEDGEVQWLSDAGWWDDAFLFNYMTLQSRRPVFNFTLSDDGEDHTGNCANADPFIERDGVLLNAQGAKRIHRIHYMGYAPADFARLSHGEDVGIRYQEIFLHYRYLRAPEQRPARLRPRPRVFIKRMLNRLRRCG